MKKLFGIFTVMLSIAMLLTSALHQSQMLRDNNSKFTREMTYRNMPLSKATKQTRKPFRMYQNCIRNCRTDVKR